MIYQVNIINTKTDTVEFTHEVEADSAYDARRAVAFAQAIDGRLEKGYEISARALDINASTDAGYDKLAKGWV